MPPPRPEDADAAWRSYRESQAVGPIQPTESVDDALQPAVLRLQLHSSDKDWIATRTMLLQKQQQMPSRPEHPDSQTPVRMELPRFASVPGF